MSAEDRERRNRERRERLAAGADPLRLALDIAAELLDEGRRDEALELLERILPALQERARARQREEGER